MPARDADRYLASAIASVLNQTFSSFRFDIVVNGSSDGTIGIAHRVAAQDPRVFVTEVSEAGTSNARNVALAGSTAPIVAFVDADDFVDSEWLQTVVPSLRAQPQHVVGVWCDLYLVYEQAARAVKPDHIDEATIWHPHQPDSDLDLGTCLAKGFPMDIFASVVFRRRAFDSKILKSGVQFNRDMQHAEGLDLIARVLGVDHSRALRRIAAKPLYHYRKHDEQMSAEKATLAKALENVVCRYMDILKPTERRNACRSLVEMYKYKGLPDHAEALEVRMAKFFKTEVNLSSDGPGLTL